MTSARPRTAALLLFLGGVLTGLLGPRALHALRPATSGLDTYRVARRGQLEALTTTQADVIVAGDSHADWGEWPELLARPRVLNRGVNGDTAHDLLARVDTLLRARPRVLALVVGTNDLLRGRTPQEIELDLTRLLDTVAARSPATRVVLHAVFPVDAARAGFGPAPGAREALNQGLRALAKARGAGWIELEPSASELASDGLHLSAAGYAAWARALTAELER